MKRILAVLTLLALVLVGCGDDSNDTPGGADAATDTTATDTTDAGAEPAVFDVTSVDFGYELSTDELPAGLVRVNQTNEGDEEHQVTLIRLDGGMTPDELVTTITEQGDGVLDPDIFAGGTEQRRSRRGQHGAGEPGGGGLRDLLLPPGPRPAGDDRAVHRHRRGPGRAGDRRGDVNGRPARLRLRRTRGLRRPGHGRGGQQRRPGPRADHPRRRRPDRPGRPGHRARHDRLRRSEPDPGLYTFVCFVQTPSPATSTSNSAWSNPSPSPSPHPFWNLSL